MCVDETHQAVARRRARSGGSIFLSRWPTLLIPVASPAWRPGNTNEPCGRMSMARSPACVVPRFRISGSRNQALSSACRRLPPSAAAACAAAHIMRRRKPASSVFRVRWRANSRQTTSASMPCVRAPFTPAKIWRQQIRSSAARDSFRWAGSAWPMKSQACSCFLRRTLRPT